MFCVNHVPCLCIAHQVLTHSLCRSSQPNLTTQVINFCRSLQWFAMRVCWIYSCARCLSYIDWTAVAVNVEEQLRLPGVAQIRAYRSSIMIRARCSDLPFQEFDFVDSGVIFCGTFTRRMPEPLSKRWYLCCVHLTFLTSYMKQIAPTKLDDSHLPSAIAMFMTCEPQIEQLLISSGLQTHDHWSWLSDSFAPTQRQPEI